jgi:hypothetical protein
VSAADSMPIVATTVATAKLATSKTPFVRRFIAGFPSP